MMRKTLIAAVAAGALVTTPVVALAATGGGTAGTPTATATALIRPAAFGTPGESGSADPSTQTVPPAPSAAPDAPPAGPAGPSAGGAGAPPGAAGPGTPPRAGAGAPPAGIAPAHPRLRWLLRHHAGLAGVLHAQWTTTAKDGTFVTHDVIHGTVQAGSAGSITVTADDNASQTYSTSDSTAVWKVVQDNGKRRIVKGSLSDVVTGATVVVEGTGASQPYAADRILVQLAS
ncbi:MAG TPA: hypothetical protein VFM01_06640 [Nakamurella sp.]|nr:hypothetical protein [Nakamurella sp.]